MKPRAKKTYHVYLVVALGTIAFLAWCHSAAPSPTQERRKLTSTSNDNDNYMAVIDAGSSGSRIHIYQYTDNDNDKVRVFPDHETMKQKPGLSSFASHPAEAGSSLHALVVFAKEHVPAGHIASTPILLKATAGLRLVQQTNPDAVAAILDSARTTLSRSGLRFKAHNAEIVSGQEEGMLGWLALNYLTAAAAPGANVRGAAAAPLWGLLEMGGASVQVSVPAEGSGLRVPAHFILDYTSPSSGQRGRMYTHSFLGLGGESAQAAIQAKLMAEDNEDGHPSAVLHNPCLPKEFTERVEAVDGDGPDTAVAGTGDYQACTDLIHRTLFTSKQSTVNECKKTASHCLWNGVASPDLSQVHKLWAFENFYYIMSGVGYMTADEGAREFKVGDYERAAREMCAKSFGDVDAHYPKDTQPKSYNKVWCFSATYVHAFLTRGLGLDPEQALMIGNSVGDVGIDWALGAVLQANSS